MSIDLKGDKDVSTCISNNGSIKPNTKTLKPGIEDKQDPKQKHTVDESEDSSDEESVDDDKDQVSQKLAGIIESNVEDVSLTPKLNKDSSKPESMKSDIVTPKSQNKSNVDKSNTLKASSGKSAIKTNNQDPEDNSGSESKEKEVNKKVKELKKENINKKEKGDKVKNKKSGLGTPKSKVSSQPNEPSCNESSTGKESKTPNKETPKKESTTPGKTPKRMLKGGIQVEDLVEGSGAECKPGNMVGMYYEGHLKENNKKFDSLKTGKPLKFKLGSGNVIKGWDVGVLGMKVGGKRRLTIPPKLGYGAQGSPPAVPPNATLVFDVECKFVK